VVAHQRGSRRVARQLSRPLCRPVSTRNFRAGVRSRRRWRGLRARLRPFRLRAVRNAFPLGGTDVAAPDEQPRMSGNYRRAGANSNTEPNSDRRAAAAACHASAKSITRGGGFSGALTDNPMPANPGPTPLRSSPPQPTPPRETGFARSLLACPVARLKNTPHW